MAENLAGDANGNVYEGMFLLDPNKYSRDPGGVSGIVTEMIEKAEGTILASRLWNEQRLAYPIKGHKKGVYWLTYFRLEGTKLTSLDHQCQLNETIIRTLFLKVEPRLVDTLVQHAQGETSAPKPESGATVADNKAADDKDVAVESAATEKGSQ